jgi:hypothetical protein
LAVRVQSVRLGTKPAPSHPASVLVIPDLPRTTTYTVGGVASPDLPLCVPPSLSNGTGWYGNLNPLSIAYAFRPRLRPDSPAVDQHRCGTLGHPVGGIRTPLALLMPTFALPPAPRRFPPPLLRRTGRSPTTQSTDCIRGVGARLEPRWIVGAPARSTSELLRTLSRMAASKPTSWLSLRRNYLAHLVWTEGP